MNGRTFVRLPYVFGLVFALVMGTMTDAEAQGQTDGIVKCVDNAANELKECVDDLPWYAEALCYARYASDGILCGVPGVLTKAL